MVFPLHRCWGIGHRKGSITRLVAVCGIRQQAEIAADRNHRDHIVIDQDRLDQDRIATTAVIGRIVQVACSLSSMNRSRGRPLRADSRQLDGHSVNGAMMRLPLLGSTILLASSLLGCCCSPHNGYYDPYTSMYHGNTYHGGVGNGDWGGTVAQPHRGRWPHQRWSWWPFGDDDAHGMSLPAGHGAHSGCPRCGKQHKSSSHAAVTPGYRTCQHGHRIPHSPVSSGMWGSPPLGTPMSMPGPPHPTETPAVNSSTTAPPSLFEAPPPPPSKQEASWVPRNRAARR